MPNLKDAPVLLVGTVIDTIPLKKRGTEEFDGRKVTVMVSDGTEPGFAVVKLGVEDAHRHNPNTMENVAWFVRSAPYAVEGNSGMSTRFIREVVPTDLDRIASQLKVTAGK